MASACLETGSDSPVKADSSAYRALHSSQRTSAGTRSPLSSSTISPGTSILAGIISCLPSRSTLALGAESCFSARSERSARNSCTNPSTPLSRIMATIVIASRYSPRRPDTSVAPISTSTIKSLNWLSSKVSGETVLPSDSSLYPLSWRLSAAVSPLRPAPG
ncbi:hypothetical protein D3C81_1034790 [compost metagenome]